jgi:hypothetical protein
MYGCHVYRVKDENHVLDGHRVKDVHHGCHV